MKLYYRYAAMNSGKSSQLLQVAHNYQERGQNVLLLKPAIDTRTTDTIGSRVGLSKPCVLIGTDENIGILIEETDASTENGIDCVLIDECQFLTDVQVWQLSDVADFMNIPVMCYGLRTDFIGNLFDGSKTLMAIADDISEIRGICDCGRKSSMVARLDSNGNAIKIGEQICIGAEEKYVSFCRRCWKNLLRK